MQACALGKLGASFLLCVLLTHPRPYTKQGGSYLLTTSLWFLNFFTVLWETHSKLSVQHLLPALSDPCKKLCWSKMTEMVYWWCPQHSRCKNFSNTPAGCKKCVKNFLTLSYVLKYKVCLKHYWCLFSPVSVTDSNQKSVHLLKMKALASSGK